MGTTDLAWLVLQAQDQVRHVHLLFTNYYVNRWTNIKTSLSENVKNNLSLIWITTSIELIFLLKKRLLKTINFCNHHFLNQQLPS